MFITILSIILIIGMIYSVFSPVIQYGSGSTFGYITTIEQSVFSNKVWIRADYTSSQTDCYSVLKKDQQLYDMLRDMSQRGVRVEMSYTRNFLYMGGCSNDVVSNVKEIKGD
jgi:hypothetical protein